MFRFIHAADIHLDSALRGLERYEGAPVDEIRGATRRAFDNLIDLAIEEEVAFVLLAGDLYDGDWKDYNTGLYFLSRMRRLREANILPFIIAGNHDAASQITKHLRLPHRVTMFSTREPESVVLNDWNVAIHGQGFATRAVTDNLSLAYPQGDSQLFNIGMLHTCLDGKPGHDRYAPCEIGGLCSKGYQYWALGHIHTREIVRQDPWIVFPGNTQGRHIGETGAKGCTLVTVDDLEVRNVEHRDLDVLRWSLCKVAATDCEDVDEIHTRVRAALQRELDTADGRPVAARVVLHGACTAHSRLHSEIEYWTQEFRALASDLGGAGLWLEKLSLQTRPTAAADELLARDDAISGLSRAIARLESDETALEGLTSEVAALRQKLPAELLGGEEHYDPTDPGELKLALAEVKELLVDRLLCTG